MTALDTPLPPPHSRGIYTIPGTEPFEKGWMLELLRHVPMPVVVVTAATRVGEEDYALRGITCSSFCSISMDPPLVSVCVHKNSQFLPVVEETPVYAVHILNDANKGLASAFARTHPNLTKQTFGSHAGAEWELKRLSELNGAAEGAPSCHVVPLLKGTMAALICQQKGLHSYGDHKMLVGEVLAYSAGGEGDPILYMNRSFHKMGETL